MRTLWIVEPSVPPLAKGWVARWKEQSENHWNWARQDDDSIILYPTRAEAIKRTAETCRNNYRIVGELSELQVRRLDGEWSKDKRTYGKDPQGNG